MDVLKKEVLHFFILFIFGFGFLKITAQDTALILQTVDTLESIEIQIDTIVHSTNITDSILKKDSLQISTKKKKWIAAILAFPFPFGVVGLHRVYLGTAPYIPLLYVATIGGVFGLLPLADFIAILKSKEGDLKSFNSRKAFFWIEP